MHYEPVIACGIYDQGPVYKDSSAKGGITDSGAHRKKKKKKKKSFVDLYCHLVSVSC